ncbi:hypothetical protein ACFV28_23140 [Streptomyces sp. NPDC059720]|uniref:hypothetical protein n=1 Tax=Streptomyces sp. NPDC059720 TaxID=3346924 RepID=UPI003679390C
MRLSRRTASLSLAAALVLTLAHEAVPRTQTAAPHARVPDARDETGPFGAACRVRVTGPEVTAYCHNPYPETDRVSLHVECVRWWDIDTDSAPVAAGPAQTVRLKGRCWKEVGGAWVSHRRGS